jgi:homoserine O-succinyltransferase
MTIILPNDYHARKELVNRGIYCITGETAQKQDIRALRIGILNIMPQAETYEFKVLHPLGRTLIQIEPVWIRLRTHVYNSTDKDHLFKLYQYFDDAIAERHLDGLIVTGAPIESIGFDEVQYWDEVVEILGYARDNIASTLGICWGGFALAKVLGIDKQPYREKLFGVFETRNINREHRITGDIDDVFWCPQSRHSFIPDSVLEDARDRGIVNLLAHSHDAGYVIFEGSDHKFMIHLGHPEYNAERLVEEYIRDRDKGRTDVDRPKNLNINNPVNRWRGNSYEFFSQWIKYVFEETPF